MKVRIQHIINAFSLFYSSLHNHEFRKRLKTREMDEQKLLPMTRTFLLGYFGESIVPEAQVALPGSLTGLGRADFMVEEVCIEFLSEDR